MLTWNLQLRDVRGLLKHAEANELSAAAVLRLRWFEFFLLHEQNISLTCRHFGIARSTLTHWLDCFRAGDPASIENRSRRPHTVRTPQTDEHVVELIRNLRMQCPRMGKEKISEILAQKHGVSVSVSTVGRIITRHRLFFAQTESHRCKRDESFDMTGDLLVGDQASSTQSAPQSRAVDDGEEKDDLPLPPLPDFGLPLS